MTNNKITCEHYKRHVENEQPDTTKCSIVTNEGNTVKELPELPLDNYIFNGTTINNVSSISYNKEGEERITETVTPDEQGSPNCEIEQGEENQVVKCRVDGENIPSNYPDAWWVMAGLPSIQEMTDEQKEKVNEIHGNVLNESFPEEKERLSYIRPFKADLGPEAGTTIYFISTEPQAYPTLLIFNSEIADEITTSEEAQRRVKMIDIHELTHFKRFLEGRNEMNKIKGRNMAKEEGETVTEALIRGDMKVRLNTEKPFGYVEGIVMERDCPLPDKYCFESLKQAKKFERFNYTLTTHRDRVKTLNPENTPNWEEIKERIPMTPILDMFAKMGKSEEQQQENIRETWIIVGNQTEQGGNWMYSSLDFNPEDELTPSKALDTVDQFDALEGDENYKSYYDYP